MRSLVGRIFETFGGRSERCFRVIFSDGSRYQNHDGTPELTLVFRNRHAEWNVLLFSHVGLLESYFTDSIDIEGDLAKAFRIAMDSGFDRSSTPLIAVRNWWHEWRFSNRSLKQAKANANYHYGLATDFYRYWLDHPAMMYTCAYWKEGTRTLEEAQRNKMDHGVQKTAAQTG